MRQMILWNPISRITQKQQRHWRRPTARMDLSLTCTLLLTYKAGCEAIQSMIKESGLPITMNIVEIQNSDSFSIPVWIYNG